MAHFFATKRDLLPVLAEAESKEPLKYVRMGRFLSRVVEGYSCGADIPNLGIATSASAVGCDRFLICEPDLAINVHRVDQSDGVRSYHIDQLYNQDTITFLTGGLWKSDILLYSRFATVYASTSKTAKRLMHRFDYLVRKHFKKVGAYYVGSEAYNLLEAGKRLTIAEQSPRDFDLPIPGAKPSLSSSD